jgi:membrane protein YdbS with pleckstrin-like domain
MESTNTILKKASFNPKLKTYIFLVVLFYMIVSVIGIVLVPFWIFGLGQWLSSKFYNTLKCELSDKNLYFSKGIILHIEKTIPLENIQDLSFFGGPILRAFGLTFIKVETAGGGGASHSNMMSIPGVDDAEEFKNMILSQREKVIKQKSTGSVDHVNTNDSEILKEIKNELVEIKNLLAKK